MKLKKILKITGIVFLSILLLLIAAPFLFESQLKDLVRKEINKNVNATVEFSDLNLTFFRSFPQATVVLKDVSVINKVPFEGDTLAVSQELLLKMSVRELFKGSGESKKIDEIRLNNAYVNIQVDSLGSASYDIAIERDAPLEETEPDSFQFEIKHYEITNSRLRYADQTQKISLLLEDLNHSGTGDFSLAQSELTTNTSSTISLDYDGTNYLNQNKLSLDAIIRMDLDEMKFTFLENGAVLNQLPLTFDGFFDVNEDHNYIDLSFRTPTSDFKNFLAVIPETYSKNIENVQTTGDFSVNGKLEGRIDDTYIPKMDIHILSNNASFKYPDLPKSVRDINIDIKLLNTSGLIEDTYLTFDDMRFRIDEDRFSTTGSLRNLTENLLVNMTLNGTINLANIEQAYPLDLEQDLNGILTADLTTSFDMNSIEKEQYQNIKSSGKAELKNFRYVSPEFPNPIEISTANLNFREGEVRVPQLLMTTGMTDINASGTILNFMGFLFTDQQLKGDFKVTSDTFSVNDFMVAEISETNPNATPSEAIKIPSFLDTKLDFSANRVLYDDLVLANTKGTLLIKDEKAELQNISSGLFDGTINFAGNVSTKEAIPSFSMQLNMNALDIVKSFNGLNLFQNIAPIAQALEGRFQTEINLSGNLNKDLTPQLQSLTGDMFVRLITAKVNPDKLPLLARMDEQLQFISLKDVNLNNLQNRLTFSDGAVQIQPYEFNVKGVQVQVAGSHGFDMQMSYNLSMDVPASYLGSDVASALASLSNQDLRNTFVSLPVDVRGTFQNPQINLNMQKAVTELTQKIVAEQKRNLTQQGINALDKLLGPGTLPQIPGQTQDTVIKTPETQIQNAAQNILQGLLGGRKSSTDTVKKN
jgi:hypothetical protein